MMSSINLENLKKRVPSVFTESGSNKTSDKYKHISTANIVNGLLHEGFVPTWATQCRTRLADKRDFTKHMMRFRHVNARPTASGLYPEIVLINSHDGLSSYRLMAGVFRLVCSNGLIAGNTYDEIRVRHQGDILGNVIEGTYRVIEDSKKMIGSAERMSTIALSNPEKKFFAEAAHSIRFENSSMSEAIEAVKLLSPRRSVEINKDDLFTVFNIAQENLIKGGVYGYAKDANGYQKRVRTRAINSIDQNTILNRALWSLAEKMMQLKGA